MSGFPGDLNDTQATALAQLSAQLTDTLATPAGAQFVARFGGHDRCLLRWLRAAGFDVSAARQRFETTLKWRIEVGANDILENAAAIARFEKVKPYWPGAYAGTSLDGLPIQFARIGQVNPQLIMQTLTEEDLQIFYIYWLELSNANQAKAMREREQAGQDPNTCRGQIEIYDCSTLSIWQMHVNGLLLLAKMLSIGERHYPENLYRGFILYIPAVFSMAWRVISPVLSENARRLITVDSGSCEVELRRLIGDAHLPTVYQSVSLDVGTPSAATAAPAADPTQLLQPQPEEEAAVKAALKESEAGPGPVNVPANLRPRRPPSAVESVRS